MYASKTGTFLCPEEGDVFFLSCVFPISEGVSFFRGLLGVLSSAAGIVKFSPTLQL